MPVITCHNVSFAYENEIVLQNINFSAGIGDYLCIAGENGAGKSTLIRGLLGLRPCASGQIVFHDGLTNRETGYLPQQTNQQKDFPASVYEVVRSGVRNKNNRNRAEDNMGRMGIWALKHRCYRELSVGQQRRVLLARALCAAERLLVLDEPVAGLDPPSVREFYEMTRQINRERNMTVIMASHDIQGAVKYASHILHIENRGPLFFGETEHYLHTAAGERFVAAAKAC
jgi:zinc transport system ATP-binding protein